MAERAHSFFRVTVVAALTLAFVVVVLGAITRLSDAGLGCPDWPGCYGHIGGVPMTQAEFAQANASFPGRPVDMSKANTEMVHRYFAGSLGVLILLLAVTAFSFRRRAQLPFKTTLALLALVIFQALLGMWTVTLQLKPVIVMAHLLGGFATLSLLWWLFLGDSPWATTQAGYSRYRVAGLLGIAILVGQIALGGWTSANYAALACTDFPTCQAQWWPPMDFSEAFVLWRGAGLDYEFGVLDDPARTAIHVTHRIGALVTTIYLLALSSTIFIRARRGALRVASTAVIALTLMQVSLGISNVVLGLPLGVAAAHNAVAALLLLAMLSLIYLLRPARQTVTHVAYRPASSRAAEGDHVLT